MDSPKKYPNLKPKSIPRNLTSKNSKLGTADIHIHRPSIVYVIKRQTTIMSLIVSKRNHDFSVTCAALVFTVRRNFCITDNFGINHTASIFAKICLVRVTRIELVCIYMREILSLLCLPIPPYSQN